MNLSVSDRPTVMKQHLYDLLHRMGQPVLGAAKVGSLHELIPLAGQSMRDGRTTALEALARLLCGVAPALELNHHTLEDERFSQTAWGADARMAIEMITDPRRPSWLRFDHSQQDLVECALLATALLRAPTALWHALTAGTQGHVIDALRKSRSLMPLPNNWVLFPAVIEAFFMRMELPHDEVRIEYALRQMEQWYLGDGLYKDGPEYRADYYNSIIIHPLLLEIGRAVEHRHIHRHWTETILQIPHRASLHASHLVRFIHRDGTYPLIGRSLTYRAGVFHLLAQSLLLGLPFSDPTPQAVLQALNSVITATLQPDGNYDGEGWLQIGINGRQEALAEPYISTGSLYFAANAFLHLGVPSKDPIWAENLPSHAPSTNGSSSHDRQPLISSI